MFTYNLFDYLSILFVLAFFLGIAVKVADEKFHGFFCFIL